MRIRILSFLILVLLSSSLSLAIGILNVPSFSDRTIFFSPGLERTYSLSFFGAEHIEIYPEGPLKDYFSIEDPQPNGGTRTVKVKIKLPDSLEPGEYMNYVVALEEAPEGVMVGGRTAVRVRFLVISLYPGKYIKASLHVKDTSVNGTINASISIKNYGQEDISEAYGIITLYADGYDNVTITTNKISVNSTKSGTMYASIPVQSTGFRRGTFNAKAVVFFDGNQKEVGPTSFRIGELWLSITPLDNEIISGMINKYRFKIYNEWDKAVSVKGKLIVNGIENPIPEFGVSKFSEKIVTGFVDATNLPPGIYDGKIILLANGKEFSKDISVRVVEQPRSTQGNRSDLLIIILVIIASL
ncbi:hypothetical protein J7K74_01685, partial [Candidatus Woesearchaeota archaeon]|nr:hypothetical protein [Candidatus Woesearchaeota archaeon]